MMSTFLFALALASQAGPAPAAEDPHAAFDAILAQVVRGERVDYALLAGTHRGALTAYLDTLAQLDPATLEASDRTAFHINLYNATMLEAVINRGPERFRPSDDGFKVFKEPLVRLKSGKVSLDHLEHEILRKHLREPRLHVALVCGAVSCPPLLARAYRGKDLEATLEANMKRFVADRTRNPIDHERRVLRLSQLFQWFRDDFGPDDAAIRQYVGRYLGRDVSGYEIQHVDYDWNLNGVR